MDEIKIFDPADGFAPLSDVVVATDSSVVRRDGQWWMYLAGKVLQREGTQLFSAALPPGAPLAATGWRLTGDPDAPDKVALLAPQQASRAWDLKGGRHCPSYVKGWDPGRGAWVERIYYAGGSEWLWGPYTIGYLEWDGARWVEQSAPAFRAEEEWEHGSVYEPNLIYAGGKWKLWYVAGSNQEDYLVQGYAESDDGRTGWSKHRIFASPEDKLFDFCVIEVASGYEAVFSRVWLQPTEPPETTGLWWCRAGSASPDLRAWSSPVQIMTAENRGWHAGPWKPSVRYSESAPNRMLVFFDGVRPLGTGGPFPYAFTLGCAELERPAP
jgi:hypothetical protein